MVLNQDALPCRDLWHYLETCLIVTTRGLEGASDIKGAESREAAEHSPVHREATKAMNSQAPNVSGVEVETAWSKGREASAHSHRSRC